MKAIGKLVVLALVMMGSSPVLAQQSLDVNCTAAEGLTTLAAALEMANPGDTINVTGPCPNTAVTITTDDVTIVGVQDAILEGVAPDQDVIDINGARRVTIQGVTVRGGNDGILARRGASVDLTNVVAQGNADDGFTIRTNSFAHLRDCTAQDNGDDGFAVAFTSSATFSGMITSEGNADDGIQIFFSSSAWFTEAMVSSTNNGQSETFGSAMFEDFIIGDGLRLTDASNLFIANSTVTIMGNANDGIAIARTSSFLASAPSGAEPVTITIAGNGDLSATVGSGGDAVQATEVSAFSATGSNLTLTIEDNARFAFVVDAATVNLFGAMVNCSERPQMPPVDPTCPAP